MKFLSAHGVFELFVFFLMGSYQFVHLIQFDRQILKFAFAASLSDLGSDSLSFALLFEGQRLVKVLFVGESVVGNEDGLVQLGPFPAGTFVVSHDLMRQGGLVLLAGQTGSLRVVFVLP